MFQWHQWLTWVGARDTCVYVVELNEVAPCKSYYNLGILDYKGNPSDHDTNGEEDNDDDSTVDKVW